MEEEDQEIQLGQGKGGHQRRERGLIRSSILCRDHKEKAAVEEKRRLQHHHIREDKKPTRRRMKRMNEKGMKNEKEFFF